MKIANIITLSRFVFAAAMLITEPLSFAFWIAYLLCGLSDIIDGAVARRLHQESDAGARLDSMADLCAAGAILIVSLGSGSFPAWLWLCIAVIALVKLACCGIGFQKYRAFAGLHTIMNKAAGILLFAFPALCAVMGLAPAGAAVCGIAFLASAEELIITLLSKELNRDRKSLFAGILIKR